MKGEEVIMRHWQELRKYACFNIYYNISVRACVRVIWWNFIRQKWYLLLPLCSTRQLLIKHRGSSSFRSEQQMLSSASLYSSRCFAVKCENKCLWNCATRSVLFLTRLCEIQGEGGNDWFKQQNKREERFLVQNLSFVMLTSRQQLTLTSSSQC